MADTLHLLIKPASGNCNMRCAYCFYADEAANRETPSFGVMDRETARILIEKSMDYAKKQCIFTFQGGEPTLAGLDYFKYFTETVRKSNKRNIPVSYNIQTNGYHLQEDWFPFLKENKFLAGVSLDGDAACHDYLRRDAKGKGTYKQVMKTIAAAPGGASSTARRERTAPASPRLCSSPWREWRRRILWRIIRYPTPISSR